METVRQGMLTLINNVRKDNGLSPVVLNNQLNRVAQGHAEDMFTRPFYGHNTPEGKTPSQRAIDGGYLHGVGENIGKGWTSVEEAMTWWLNSPAHRANILNPTYTDVGIGVRGDSKVNDTGFPNSYNTYWVQDFGDSNSLFCNGKLYNPCQDGKVFSCASNGGICQSRPPLVQTCSDGTTYGLCSEKQQPKYCDNGQLVDRASKCGCPSRQPIQGENCGAVEDFNLSMNESITVAKGNVVSQTISITIPSWNKEALDFWVIDEPPFVTSLGFTPTNCKTSCTTILKIRAAHPPTPTESYTVTVGSRYIQKSFELKIVDRTPPAAPVLQVTPISSSQIKLDWSDNAKQDEQDEMLAFVVERKIKGDNEYKQIYEESTTLFRGGNLFSYTNSGLNSGMTYCYRIYFKDFSIWPFVPNYSKEQCATLQAAPDYPSPKNTITINTCSSIEPAWISVEQRESVYLVNRDSKEHVIKFPDKSSFNLKSGEQKELTDQFVYGSGTYGYDCDNSINAGQIQINHTSEIPKSQTFKEIYDLLTKEVQDCVKNSLADTFKKYYENTGVFPSPKDVEAINSCLQSYNNAVTPT
ncbi:MAG: CAP domain-containing protein [Patescibacteria group bacterium]